MYPKPCLPFLLLGPPYPVVQVACPPSQLEAGKEFMSSCSWVTFSGGSLIPK